MNLFMLIVGFGFGFLWGFRYGYSKGKDDDGTNYWSGDV